MFYFKQRRKNYFYEIVPKLLQTLKQKPVKISFSATDNASQTFINSRLWKDICTDLGIDILSVVKGLKNKNFSKMDINKDEYIHGFIEEETDADTAVCYIFNKDITYEGKIWYLYIKLGVSRKQTPYIMSFHLDTKKHGKYSKVFDPWTTIVNKA